MRRADSDSLSERDEHSESISSMKTIDGLLVRAMSNRLRTSFSDSPNHLDTRSDDETEKNVELLASVATALARKDFPVPGGCQTRFIIFERLTKQCEFYSTTVTSTLQVLE